MTDTNDNSLAQILAALQATNQSISNLKSTVEKQAETINELRAGAKTNKINKDDDIDESTLTPNELKMQAQLNKVLDQNNKFHLEQRKEKLHKTVQEKLLERGVDPKRLDIAHSYIKDKVSIDKAGTMKMLDENGVENNLDMELDKFCDSETGSFFKPAVEVQGTGVGSFRPGTVQNKSLIKPPTDPNAVMPDRDFSKMIEQSLGIR